MARLLSEFFEQLALSRIELGGHFYEDTDVEIPPHLHELLMLHTRLKRREPLAAKAQHATRLGAFRDLEIYGAFEGGYFDFGAECSLDEGDGDFDVNVDAIQQRTGDAGSCSAG